MITPVLLMNLRFRAEPGQASNLRVRVYSLDRTLLATVTNGITETIPNSGSYVCSMSQLSGYWYVLVDFKDSGEVTSDGFASQWVLEVVDYLPPSSGLGQYAITVRVQSASVAVPNAQVTVSQSGNTVAWATANSQGDTVFALNAGTYSVLVQPPNSSYSPLAVQTLVVSATATVTYSLTQQSITPPASPGLCVVRFFVLDAGVPVANARVQVEIVDANPMVDSALIARTSRFGTTDVGGVVDLTMIQQASFTRGGKYKITVTDPLGRVLHSRQVTVPATGTIYAEDLPDAA